jgi:hypothetical protein
MYIFESILIINVGYINIGFNIKIIIWMMSNLCVSIRVYFERGGSHPQSPVHKSIK